MASVTYVSPPMLKDIQVKAKGSNLPFTSCSASSLSVVVGLKRKKIKKINKYFSLTIQSPHRPGEQSGQAVAFHSFLSPLLFVLLLKNHVRQSQCPLCRRDAITHFPAGSTAVHITATSHVQIITTHMHYFFYFFFPTPESTWCIKMVEHCLNSTQFHFKKCMLCF